MGMNILGSALPIKKSRAEKAGEELGKAIVEMAHLMYQSSTTNNFYRGLNQVLTKEKIRRLGNDNQEKDKH